MPWIVHGLYFCLGGFAMLIALSLLMVNCCTTCREVDPGEFIRATRTKENYEE